MESRITIWIVAFALSVALIRANLRPVVLKSTGYGDYLDGPKCQEITIPMCRTVGYNMTFFPNFMDHDDQDDAGMEVHQFWPLVEIHCAPELRFFLCSMYTPICFEDYHKPLTVCRGICERARDGCAPLMEQYGFNWPEKMDCSKFPEKSDDQNLCMEPPTFEDIFSTKGYDRKPPKYATKTPLKCKPGAKGPKGCRERGPQLATKGPTESDCECKCRHPLITIEEDSIWHNRSISVAGVENCAYPCRAVFFTEEEKTFATTWLAVWSTVCATGTLMTVATFFIDSARFKYPERPIVFLSGCYFMVSCGYLVRVFVGHENVACVGNTIAYKATGPTPCILTFLLTYFFGMAASVWWIILTITWFLAAGLKWSNEAVAGYSQYFHLTAWLVPTAMSVGVLIMSAVDGDAVSGICFVGNQNEANLIKFLLIPQITFLSVGVTFLIAGFVALFNIRKTIKRQGGTAGRRKADKLQKLMVRIGVYSVCYTVPASVMICCYFFEMRFHAEWNRPIVCPCEEVNRREMSQIWLIYAVFMLKYFNALAVGMTSGCWIWSKKTLASWSKFWGRLCGGNGRPNSTSVDATIRKERPLPNLPRPQYLHPPSIPIPPIPGTSDVFLPPPHFAAIGHFPRHATTNQRQLTGNLRSSQHTPSNHPAASGKVRAGPLNAQQAYRQSASHV